VSKIGAKERATMVSMRAVNKDIEEIAEKVGVSRNTITTHLNTLQDEAEKGKGIERTVLEILAKRAVEKKSKEELLLLCSKGEEDE
jgi:predicted transcriptional regulator